MSSGSDSPLDRLWIEYGLVFKDFDDHTLARWMSQTLSQLHGRVWRLSHPLLGAYRLAAQIGHDRQVWLKRLASPPHGYPESPCCRAPLLPLFTRDITESGLVCQHCAGSAVPYEDIADELRSPIQQWAKEYAAVHAVAHWDDPQRRSVKNYDRELERAAEKAELLLAKAGLELIPRLLEFFPAVVWEDQDECLDIRPEDIETSPA
ncbi:MAG: hypothetical protein FJ404_01985 [Verrucomicrobia bacterium]|nr:hypothetical protein [Verrucomicrobiota bacterium]